MGSWNETCMVSNLPVMYGEDVVCFLIKKSRYDVRNIHEAKDLYTPISLPIRAKHNDYGGVEPGDRNLAFIHANSVVNIDDFPNDNDRDYAFIFIKESIYRPLIDRSRINIDRYYTLTEDRVKEAIDHMREKNALPMSMIIRARQEDEDRMYSLFSSLQEEELDDRDIKNITDLLNEDMLFNMILGRLRKFWMPTGNKGSQSINYYEHLVLIEAMRNSINKEIINCDADSIYLQLMGLRDY